MINREMISDLGALRSQNLNVNMTPEDLRFGGTVFL